MRRAGLKSDANSNERRGAGRFPIEREIRYRVLNRKTAEEFGLGKTIDVSSNGIFFTTEQYMIPGRRIEIAMNWPVQLNGNVGLKLIARGRVVRTELGRAAIEVQQHEFRTQAAQA